MRVDVAALYVDARGVYPSLVRHWYDEARNAKTYEGPFPVVCHPPCGPWGSLRFMCTKQDRECALVAVRQARRYGGVLEHPAGSLLWDVASLPKPGDLPDEWGGRTIEVEQVAWSHPCTKPTWLYIVRVPSDVILRGLRVGGTPTHRVTSGPRGPKLPSASRKARTLTPPTFASWLVELASCANVGWR